MKLKFQNLLPLFFLIAVTLGCSAFNQIKNKIEETQKPQIITSTDGKCQLTFPGSWKTQANLNEQATLQMANPSAEQYTIVISEPKADFGSGFNLDDFTNIIVQNVKTVIAAPVITDIKATTVNGYPAKQFEVEGEMDKIKAKWLYTIIDAPKNYHQILVWSTASKYAANKPGYLEIIGSFKEIEGMPATQATK